MNYHCRRRSHVSRSRPRSFRTADGFWHERLEDRLCLATVPWDGGGDGTLWTDELNWAGDQLPGPNDDVVIDTLDDATIVIGSGNHSIQSLYSSKPFTVAGGSLNVATTVEIDAAFVLGGGTLRGATVLPGSSIQVATPFGVSAVLDGVVLNRDLLVTDSSALSITNGLELNGMLRVEGASGGVIFEAGEQTLSGTGEVILAGTGNRQQITLVSFQAPNTLTVGPDIVIRGTGLIGLGSVRRNPELLINQGQIVADVPGQSLFIALPHQNEGLLRAQGGGILSIGSTWTNLGQIEATDATLEIGDQWTNADGVITSTNSAVRFGGMFTTVELGTFHRTGGTVEIVGTFDNRGETLTLDATTGSWILSNGGRIWGGTVTTDGASLEIGHSFTGGGGLDGVTLNTDLTIPNNSVLGIFNGLELNGVLRIENTNVITASVSGGLMVIGGDQILSGSGEIVLAGAANRNQITLGQFKATTTLTIMPDITVRGRGVITGSSSTIINYGTIAANESGQSLSVALTLQNEGRISVENGGILGLSSAWTNLGQIEATDATLEIGDQWTNADGVITSTNSAVRFGGMFTTVELGTFHRTGGTVEIVGTFDNRGETLTLDATTGSWILSNGGRIWGGTVTTDGASLEIGHSFTGGGGLDGVTLNTDLTIPNNSVLGIFNGLELNGVLRIENTNVITASVSGGLVVTGGDQILSGTGEVVLAGAANRIQITIAGSQTTAALTVAPGMTIRGKGIIAGSNRTLVNQALIVADVPGEGLTVGAVLQNESLVEARPGTSLAFSSNPANLTNGTLSGGVWRADSGQIHFASRVTVNAARIELIGDSAAYFSQGTNAFADLFQNAADGVLYLDSGAHASTDATLSNLGRIELGLGCTFTAVNGFVNNPDAFLAVQIGGNESSGLYGRLTTPSIAALAGNLDLDLVDGYVPEAADGWSVVGYGSRVGEFTHIEGLYAGRQLLFETAYTPNELRFTSLINATDLRADSISHPPTGISGESITITYTASNLHANATVASTWVDSVYLSADGKYDATDRLIGRVEHVGTLAGQSSYSETLTAPLPGILPGTYRIIVIADSRGLLPDVLRANNSLSSASTIQVDMLSLEFGTSTVGAISNGQPMFYRVDVPGGVEKQLLVDLTSAGQAEAYVRHGNVPNLSTYTQAAVAPSDSRLSVTWESSPGTSYIMLRGREAAGQGQPIVLTVSAAALTIASFSLAEGSNQGSVTMTIRGAGFTEDTVARLVSPTETRDAIQTEFRDSSTLLATFDLTGLSAGAFVIRVVDGPKSADAATPFTVNENLEPGRLSLGIATPPLIGVGQSFTARLSFTNVGHTNTPPVTLIVHATNASPSRHAVSIGSLAPGQGGTRSFTFTPTPEASGVVSEFSISVAVGTPVRPEPVHLDWESIKPQLRPDGVDPEAWNIIFENFVGRVGDTLTQFNRIVDEDAAYLRSIGSAPPEQFSATSNDLGAIFGFEFSHADNALPAQTLAFATDAALPAPGLPLSFGRSYDQAISSRFRTGLFGRGWTTPWETFLALDAAGNATIHTGGLQRYFSRNRNGTFQPQPGDVGILLSVDGAYRLREHDGSIAVFGFDGKLDYIEDPNGNQITASYVGDQLRLLSHASGAQLALEYGESGYLERLTDSAGRVITYAYDAEGEHLIRVTGPLGTVEYAYGDDGVQLHALTAITDVAGSHVFFTYDDNGRLERISRDGGAEPVTYAYKAPGRLTVSDDAGTTSLRLNQFGQIEESTDPYGNTVILDYDDTHNLTTTRLPGHLITSFTYDTRGNLTSVVDALGHETTFEYSPTFHLPFRVTDARGNSLVYRYDTSGNLSSITYPDGSIEQYEADEAGNPVSVTNRRSQEINYEYDSRGLVTRQTFPDGSSTEFTYDARGNLKTATDASGTTTLEWDAADRMTRVSYPTGRFLEYSYDGNRRSLMVDSDGFSVRYDYDAVGRLSQASSANGDVTVTYTYDASGRVARKVNGNGTYTTYSYGAAGELRHLINHGPDGSFNSRFDYEYDALGRQVAVDTLNGKWTYDYDATGQLVGAIFDSADPGNVPSHEFLYEYDAVGNRVRTVENGVATLYDTNTLNQYTAIGSNGLTYDADGNLVSERGGARTTIFSYDAGNRPVLFSNDGTTTHFEYDSLGNRSAMFTSTERTEFLIDPSRHASIATAAITSSGRSLYIYGHGLTATVGEAGSVSYFDADGAGSIVGASTSDGTVVSHQMYAPFGEVLQGTDSVGTYGFAGQFGLGRHSSSLIDMRARLYDTSSGRFLSEDPLGLAGGTVNTRVYAGNNPVRWADPLGLDWVAPESVLYARGASDYVGLDKKDVLVFVDAKGVPVKYAIPMYREGRKIWSTSLPVVKHEEVRQDVGRELAAKAILHMSQVPLVYHIALALASEPQEDPFKEPLEDAEDALSFGISWLTDGFKVAAIEGVAIWLAEQVGDGDEDATIIANSNRSESEQINRFSADPNDIVGPPGVGDGRFLADDPVILPYTIRFENREDATAAAREIFVTQHLDPDLDWSTFELGEFGFGDVRIQIPEGRTSYATTIDLTETIGELVGFEAQINLITGIATWELRAIDPETGDVVASPFGGFLPPNMTPPEGDGFVSYTVRQRPNLTTGTRIDAEATIIFDINDPIVTPPIFNTIDADPPASAVIALDSLTNTEVFLVSWGGEDPGGSGIESHDIYVSVDDGPFAPWMTRTAETSSLYTGSTGRTYRFYSIATDYVGHVEEPPETPDATTTIVAALTVSAGGDQTADEGDTVHLSDAAFAFVGDPSILTATVNWGDGTTEPAILVFGPGGGTIGNEHVYADNGTFTVAVTITDGTTMADDSLNIIINNVAPTAIGGQGQNVDEGDLVALSGSLTDPGTGDTHTFLWTVVAENGDVIPSGASQSFGFTPNDNGTYSVTFRVTDDDGDYTEDEVIITVNSVAPTATLFSGGDVLEGSSGSVSLSGQFDPSAADAFAGFTYSFDFNNDGTFDVTGTSPTATVPATFLNDGPGGQTVRARIEDKDEVYNDYTTTISIENVAPTATLTNSGPVLRGTDGLVSFIGQHDPSSADTGNGFTYYYDFDNDGTFEINSTPDSSATVPGSYLNGTGFQTVAARIEDKDGGYTDYTTDIAINTPTNEAPTAQPQSVTVTEDGSVEITLSAFDVETPESALIFTILSLPSHGVLLDPSSGLVDVGAAFISPPSLVYQPSATRDEFAGDSFAFVVTDGGANGAAPITSAPATIDISVIPAIADGVITIDSDGIVRIGGTASDDDIIVTHTADGDFLEISVGGSVVSNSIPLADTNELRIWVRGGNDRVELVDLALAAIVSGGRGNDILIGAAGDDILLGGTGDDELFGASGDDFLLGGLGADRQVGASGHDILLANDLDCSFSQGRLKALLDDWKDDQEVVDSTIDELFENGVLDDALDQLTGASGTDWFFVDSNDDITDAKNQKKNDLILTQ